MHDSYRIIVSLLIGFLLVVGYVIKDEMDSKIEELLFIKQEYIELSIEQTKLIIKNARLKQELFKIKDEYGRFVKEYFFIEANLTAYTTCYTETNRDNNNTALMQEPVVGWTVAVSRDLSYLLGKTVYIEGIGVRYVNDLMNSRFKNTVDVLVPNKSYAMHFGVKKGRQVILLTDYDKNDM